MASVCMSVKWQSVFPTVSRRLGQDWHGALGLSWPWWQWGLAVESLGGVCLPVPSLFSSGLPPLSKALTYRSPCGPRVLSLPGLCVPASPGFPEYWRPVAWQGLV